MARDDNTETYDVPFGPFDHQTTIDFEKGRIEELNGFLLMLGIERDQHPSASVARLIKNVSQRLKSVESNFLRISAVFLPN